MLKLSTSGTAPYWLELLPDVRVQVEPISVASILVARDDAGKVLFEEGRDDALTHANVALVRRLAHRGIKGWDGIGDAQGEPIGVTPDALDAALDDWRFYEAIDRLYVGPALDRSAEKNVSANSPDGISAGAKTTAKPAA